MWLVAIILDNIVLETAWDQVPAPDFHAPWHWESDFNSLSLSLSLYLEVIYHLTHNAAELWQRNEFNFLYRFPKKTAGFFLFLI